MSVLQTGNGARIVATLCQVADLISVLRFSIVLCCLLLDLYLQRPIVKHAFRVLVLIYARKPESLIVFRIVFDSGKEVSECFTHCNSSRRCFIRHVCKWVIHVLVFSTEGPIIHRCYTRSVHERNIFKFPASIKSSSADCFDTRRQNNGLQLMTAASA